VDASRFVAAIPELAATAHRDFCTSGNPIAVTEADLAGLLRLVV
jgi:alcohol dehydrogenase class IV